ncbi:MAG: type II toxin-antitoxin system HigB family toxin [Planctomycetes bacterium]|nr:type II toxin-antitoxin system HigB family toxin [Planctomycetota bacterium]
MRILNRGVLDEALKKYADARGSLRAWLVEAKAAEWRTPNDIKIRYSSVSFVGGQSIFNIGGNKYRLVVQIAYQSKIVSIKWFGTHADYSRRKW